MMRQMAFEPASMHPELFYCNRVVPAMADPGILRASDGRYYLVATTLGNGFSMRTSENMVDWSDPFPCMTEDENYWGFSHYWAPELNEYNGRFWLVYSCVEQTSGLMKIGLAVSDLPCGPYRNLEKRPFFDPGPYSVIDGHLFFDQGRVYLFYSRDCSTNLVEGRRESHCYGVELAADLSGAVSEPVLVSKPTLDWEKQSGDPLWNEGPYVLRQGNSYYLAVSANFYAGKEYSLMYATAPTPLGPYRKMQEPLLRYVEGSDGQVLVSGPGHHTTTLSPDGTERFVVYHAHTYPQEPSGHRDTCIDRLVFKADGSLYACGPTNDYQPRPAGTTPFCNIAKQATLIGERQTAMTLCGLTDGVFSVGGQDTGSDVTLGGDGESLTMSFASPRTVTAICVYPGIHQSGEHTHLTVCIDEEQEMTAPLPSIHSRAGAQVSFVFSPVSITKIRLSVHDTERQPVSLSEIVILGE